MKKVENLIIATLEDLIDLKCITDADSETRNRLVYPIKRCETIRISEQEARFLFVKHVEDSSEYFYSIEAPTKEKYSFTGTNQRSGSVDVCLYNEMLNRKHLIEFKALNGGIDSISKDFEKLFNDEVDLNNYFIHILRSTDSRTIVNVEDKYIEAIKYVGSKYGKFNSRLTIFLCDINMNNKDIDKQIIKYKVDENGKLSEPITVL